MSNVDKIALRAACAENPGQMISLCADDVMALLEEIEELREEVGGVSEVNASFAKALKGLAFSARTSGGTEGSDAHLMAACEYAERMLSIGGIGRAYMVGAESVYIADGLRAEIETLKSKLKACHPFRPAQEIKP